MCQAVNDLKNVTLPTIQLGSLADYVISGPATNHYSGKSFTVTCHDCLVDADEMVTVRKYKTMMVNSASALRPGGGVRSGSRAQEEHLCRNSNLFLHLEKVNQQLVKYPLHGKVCGIHCHDVKFFRNGFNFQCDVFSVFSTPRDKNPNSYRLHLKIWKQVLDAAREHQIEALILPPIGCGVFGHDASDVARALRTVIQREPPFPFLKSVIISCYSNDDNYNAFNKMLSSLSKSH